MMKCDSFRDAEASLPLLKQGAPTDNNQPGLKRRLKNLKKRLACALVM